MPRMITTLCVIAFTSPPFVADTACANDPMSEAAIHYATLGAKKPKPKPEIIAKKRRDHGRPSPARMNMVTILPGTFMMGSPQDEARRDANEGPRHKVTIDYPFEVGKFEVTFSEWNACVAGGGCRGHRPNDGGWGKGNRPVINVSWQDAKSYIKWLRRRTGLNYRLLSEAEWEYVARAGQEGPFSMGYSIGAYDANFNGEKPYGGGPSGPYLRKTVPVGSYPANAFGLHDIHGNVYEWVEDCWSPNHSGAPANGSARKDGDCKFRVMRGGSWVTHGYQMRASKRLRYTTDYRYDDYGFRVARTLGN